VSEIPTARLRAMNVALAAGVLSLDKELEYLVLG